MDSNQPSGPAIGEVLSVNISSQKGVAKTPVNEATIDKHGIVGDAHAGAWHRQVSLLSGESIDRFSRDAGRIIHPGEFAENITIRGLDNENIRLLDRIRIGCVILEVSQIGKACHGKGCSIFQQVGRCIMPDEGLFTRVLEGGKIHPGDKVSHERRKLHVRVITISDRVSRGETTDTSGPTVCRCLNEFAMHHFWDIKITTALASDEWNEIDEALTDAERCNADIIITTGGTGPGPRDVTPDVATKRCNKIIPGIMEFIRIKYAYESPNALLSRTVAGIMNTALVYTLPGKPKAAEEYMSEITKTLEHLLYVQRSLDAHS